MKRSLVQILFRLLLGSSTWLSECYASEKSVVVAEAIPAAYPSENKSWKREGHEGQFIAFQKDIQKLMKLPPDVVIAHPAAVDFPGEPPKDAQRIEHTLVVDTHIPRWHSTGLYAVPGEIITTTVPVSATTGKLRLRIGCHKDLLWSERISAWKRVPEITRCFDITNTMTRAANAFGGPVYIVVSEGCQYGEVQVKIQNCVAAPLFDLRKSDIVDWKNRLRNAPAPWAELVGEKLAVSLPSANVRELDNPDEVLRFWDLVVTAEDELSGQTNRNSPERFVLDRQISAGYMHSGYPIMAHLDQSNKVASLAVLKKGNWGFFHELGHNHQRPEWKLSGTGEITVNLFSMYCFEKVCGLSRHGHSQMNEDNREKNLRTYFNTPSEIWTSNPFTGLNFYDQLIEGFGWDAFHKVFVEYRDLPENERPHNDDEKRDQWLVRFSKNAGRNLGSFFETWRIPTSQYARDQITNLPVWLPEPHFPDRYLTHQ